MANKATAEGKQLVDLGGGVFAEKVVAVSTTGTDIAGGGGGGGAVTVADAADVAEGAVADAVVAAGAAGTLSAKLRRLTTDLGAMLLQLPASLGQKTAAASLSVIQASDQVGPGVDVVATGALGALNNAVTISTKGLSSVVAEVDTGGTLSGTVIYEGTSDDANWIAIMGIPLVANTTWNSQDTAFPSRRVFSVGGFSQFRARVSAYTSGTSNGRLRGSIAAHIVRLGPGLYTEASGADNISNSLSNATNNNGGSRLTGIAEHFFNATVSASTWDRARNNYSVAILASAARTTTQTGADILTYNARYLRVILDMTVVGTGSVTVSIQGKSLVGTYYTLLTGAAITTNVPNVYEIGPGLPATANVSANTFLPRTIRVIVTANNANSATYSLDYDLSV